MPVYDYKCEKCSKVSEIEHRIGDLLSKHCPDCGGSLKRAYNVGGIVFKGKGFHVNDYAKRGKSETKPSKSAEPKPSKS
jgi:putative FmdB family regulatory protein